MSSRARNIASKWLAYGVMLLLLMAVVVVSLEMAHRPASSIPKVMVGTRDEVYYSRGATIEQATDLGRALQSTGFLNDRGSAVMVSRASGLPVISFVVNDGAWDRPETVESFEEIGRRVAGAIGGFPIQIRLVNEAWTTQKSVVVGKQQVGRDNIYYLGSATAGDAKALGQALRGAGYLEDLGVTVVVSKGDGTTIGFVVGEGLWERPGAAASFEQLARRVAASVGGLPLTMRLLDPQMETKRQLRVR